MNKWKPVPPDPQKREPNREIVPIIIFILTVIIVCGIAYLRFLTINY